MVHVNKLLAVLIMATVALGLEQTIIPNLRQFSTKGWGGEFGANKDVLTQEIRKRFMQDSNCGKDMFQELQESFNEVAIFYESLDDHTLQGVVPDCLQREVATNFRQLSVMMQIADKPHLQLVRFTDSTKRVLNPFATNHDTMNYIDRIEDDREGNVTLFKGDDFMSLKIEDDPNCDEKDSEKLKEEFKYIELPKYKSTNYPLPFDWGCDILGEEVKFCEELKKKKFDLQKVKGDVCNLIQTRYISICRASMQITDMTGYFRESLPAFAPFRFPLTSLDAESSELYHTAGVIYPCLIGI